MAASPRDVPVMLLHCYPYHREAGYLAQVFPHVYMDVGEAVNYTGARSPAVLAESLELAPFGKALFSSDAWGAAELHHLGALLWRRGMAAALARFVEAGEWTTGGRRPGRHDDRPGQRPARLPPRRLTQRLTRPITVPHHPAPITGACGRELHDLLEGRPVLPVDGRLADDAQRPELDRVELRHGLAGRLRAVEAVHEATSVQPLACTSAS